MCGNEENPMIIDDHYYDVIIVGTGAGGGTLAYKHNGMTTQGSHFHHRLIMRSVGIPKSMVRLSYGGVRRTLKKSPIKQEFPLNGA